MATKQALMTPYLNKSALFPAQIYGAPAKDLAMVVVIPAYREKEMEKSLEALRQCERPGGAVEVIVVINDGENSPKVAKRENKKLFKEACAWATLHSDERLKYHILYHSNLLAKHAGVGLARKIGMDEAVFRLEKTGNSKGVIVCFDADALCEKNYLVAIFRHFQKNPRLKATGIYFEHPLSGNDFSRDVYAAIAEYELHLRYYIHAQRYAGCPFAYQTIGSSMAVRCDAYQRQGGMNRRKAGEDFYFLHKFIMLGDFDELTATKVIPSPRISKRVPFGTGKAVGEIVKANEMLTTYAFESFVDLKAFFELVPQLAVIKMGQLDGLVAGLSPAMQAFLIHHDLKQNIREIRANTSNPSTFTRRFFRWFDAFKLMKYVHHCRDGFYENTPVLKAAKELLEKHYGKTNVGRKRVVGVLRMYREMDRGL